MCGVQQLCKESISPLGVPGDLRAVSWSSLALRYAFAFTGVRIRLNQFVCITAATVSAALIRPAAE
jgi:hypothetical protein